MLNSNPGKSPCLCTWYYLSLLSEYDNHSSPYRCRVWDKRDCEELCQCNYSLLEEPLYLYARLNAAAALHLVPEDSPDAEAGGSFLQIGAEQRCLWCWGSLHDRGDRAYKRSEHHLTAPHHCDISPMRCVWTSRYTAGLCCENFCRAYCKGLAQ